MVVKKGPFCSDSVFDNLEEVLFVYLLKPDNISSSLMGRLPNTYFSSNTLSGSKKSRLLPKNQHIYIYFINCFLGYVGQPHGHIGCATSMLFASINSTNPRTNPWNFHEKKLRTGVFENLSFLIRPFWVSFQKNIFFCLIPMKISQHICNVARMGRNFDNYPGLQEKSKCA